MNALSFNIKTTKDFFKKLIEDYEDFKKDSTSAKTALNCAMTAWHLSEWAFHEYNSIISPHFKSLGLYQQDLKNQCPSLQIMHDLANGTKHYHLTKHTPIVRNTKLHEGAFSNEFSREFDVSSLNVELTDGTITYFENEIEKAVNFWRSYLTTSLNINLS